MPKPEIFRVAPNSVPFANANKYPVILIIPQAEADGRIRGIWVPNTWADIEVNQRTLKVVSKTALDQVDTFAYYAQPPKPLPNQILISDSPLTYSQATSFLDTMEYKDGAFTRTLGAIQAASLLMIDTDELYQRYLRELTDHLNRTSDLWLNFGAYSRLRTVDQASETQEAYMRQTKLFAAIVDEPIPTNNAKIRIAQDIYTLLNDRLIEEFVQQVSFAELSPLISQWNERIHDYFVTIQALKMLAFEEFRVVLGTKKPINGNEVFILNMANFASISEREDNEIYPIDIQSKRLSIYLGFPHDQLDLSRCYLTGPVIPAISRVYDELSSDGDKTTVKLTDLYSPTQDRLITDLGDWAGLFRRTIAQPIQLLNTKVDYAGDSTIVRIGPAGYQFNSVQSPFQVYVYVPNLDDLDEVANEWYQVVLQYYPNAKLEQADEALYIITGALREISIVQMGLNDILSSPIPMVRGWITDINDDRTINVSATCMLSLLKNEINSYYQFMPKVDVGNELFTWIQLGFDNSDWLIRDILDRVNQSLGSRPYIGDDLLIKLSDVTSGYLESSLVYYMNKSMNVKGAILNKGVYKIGRAIEELQERS